jgi:hypothetical protein
VIVKTPESMALKARLDDKNKDCVAARKKRAELQSHRPMRSSGSYASNFAHFCKDTKTFTIIGTRVEISVRETNITELDSLIQSHNRKIEKLGDLRARAASNVLETRRLAQSERRNINKQLALPLLCKRLIRLRRAFGSHLSRFEGWIVPPSQSDIRVLILQHQKTGQAPFEASSKKPVLIPRRFTSD